MGTQRKHRSILGVMWAVCMTGAGAGAGANATSSLSPATGRWEGSAVHDGRRFAVDIAITDARNGATVLVDYPDVPVYAAEFTLALEAGRVTLSRHPRGGPESRMVMTGSGDRLNGRFTGAGAVDAELALTRTATTVVALRETTLVFANRDTRLAGTLVRPAGTGPFPAVVIGHGSGAGHRGQALYRTEAFRYARRGVAALIYDKRGEGESSGDWRRASLHDLARDALAGVAALRALPDIRADRIGVAGHSQGGWIAPLAATLGPDVAFVVATSASGLGPMAQSLHHNANVMRAAGFEQHDIDAAQALRRRLYDEVRAGAFSEALEHDLRAASALPWFAASELPTPRLAPVSTGERDLLLFDPLPVWRAVRVPVLAIWGEDDIHLPARASRDLIATELAARGNGEVALHLMPGLDHGFMQRAPADGSWDFPRGSREVEALTSAWLHSRVIGEGDPS